ncbi:MAG: hypothetical protein HY454_02765 [Parcubacteria group bacterium]|nr:hypothetical protein [Parcubacteria group bacterium]
MRTRLLGSQASKTIVRFVVLLAAISLTACGKGPSLTTPTPIPNPGPGPGPGPTPVPEPPKYPDLPHRECAKNLETGEELPDCRMWAELQLGIKPPRGSVVKVGDQYCPDPLSTCFEADVKFGFKGVDDPGVGMGAKLYWSMDGKTPVGVPISTEVEIHGEKVKHYGPWIWQVVPKYLLVQLGHAQGCGSCDPAEEGWVSFFVNYEEKR